MALSPTTGNPPAVTHEQIEKWSELADFVTSALTAGGQQGMDMLMSIMAEWCEAVDDVNAARQVCVDFAERGLRHEAIHWHAEGFFEVADRLDPERPGWEQWEQAFQEREVVTPHIDPDLKELANRIHDDLVAQDLTGQSMTDYLAALRRNTLLRGHLGERLTILESIRGLDPSGPTWQDMIRPIRRRRVDAIGDEVKAAVARRDFEALAALRAEAASQNWGDGLPAAIVTLLEASGHCESLGDLRGRLSQAAAVIVGRVDEARRQPAGLAAHTTAIEAATTARDHYAQLRSAIAEAVQGAAAAPETAAIVAETGVKEAVRQLDAAVREAQGWLDQQEQAARMRAEAAEIEAPLLRHIESAPAKISNLEEFRTKLGAWLKRADDGLEQGRKAAARLTGGVPASTEDVFRQLKNKRRDLETHLQTLRRREQRILLYFLIGFAVLVLVIVAAIVVGLWMK